MDTLNRYRQIIEDCLTPYANIRYSVQDISNEAVFDRSRDRYVVMSQGWDNNKRVHGSLIHVEIIDGKVWVQRDGTEVGIAIELANAGIPKEDIVFGFRRPEHRPLIQWGQAG